VERWFALITQRAIRRGSFRSVRYLVRKINSYLTHYNASKRPFIFADSILGKLQRLFKVISGTQH
jgi:putative transposase